MHTSDGAVFHDSENSNKPPDAVISMRIIDLPQELLVYCLSFVGPGHYRYVAGTCHSFRDVCDSESFRGVHNMDEGEQKRTTWDAAAASIPCVELCLEDLREMRQRVNVARFMANIARKAAKMGKKNVLKWLKERHFLDAEGMQGACWGAC